MTNSFFPFIALGLLLSSCSRDQRTPSRSAESPSETQRPAPIQPAASPEASSPRISQDAVGKLRFHRVMPGLEYYDGLVHTGDHAIRIWAARASQREFHAGVGIPEDKSDGAPLPLLSEQYRAEVVISGGFLKAYYPPLPLGWVKQNGIVLNREVGGTLLSGALVTHAGKVRILPVALARNDDRFEDCLQSGPLLVSGARSALSLDELSSSDQLLAQKGFQRAFVAVLPNDSILLGITEEVSLPLLVEVLTRSEQNGGFAAVSALNLSGAQTAGLLVRVGAQQYAAGNTQAYLANSIYLKSSHR